MRKGVTMEISIKDQNAKQYTNAGKLLAYAGGIGMDCSGYGMIGYNDRYGNTYLWLENYGFTLFISDFSDEIMALYSCSYNGEETKIEAPNFAESTKNLPYLNNWATEQWEISEAKNLDRGN